MQRFTSNPPSRRIAPVPLLVRSHECPQVQPAVVSPHGDLQRRVECYLADSGMAPTAFGRMAVKDSTLIRDMRQGRQFSDAMIAKIKAFLDMVESARGKRHA